MDDENGFRRADELQGRLAGAMSDLLRSFEYEIIPEPGETSAVTLTMPKTAALCYDRVWAGVRYDIPDDIGFRGITSEEMYFRLQAIVLDALSTSRSDTNPALSPHTQLVIADILRAVSPGESDLSLSKATQHITRAIAECVASQYDVSAVPLYESRAARESEYRSGDRSVLVATLSNVALVDENAITWEQVSELRRDAGMLRKFRRLAHWLDAEMVGKSLTFVQDEIAIRLDDYEAAIKKHGLMTTVGTLEAVLDSKALIGGSAAVASLSYAADLKWALLGGGIVLASSAHCRLRVHSSTALKFGVLHIRKSPSSQRLRIA